MTQDASHLWFGCLCQKQRACICRVSTCYKMETVFFKIRFIELAHSDLSRISMVHVMEITPLEKSDPHPTGWIKIASVPQLAVGLHDLILRISSTVSLCWSWAFGHGCCLCSNPIASRNHSFLILSYYLWLLQSFHPLSHCDPRALDRRDVILMYHLELCLPRLKR